MSASSTTQRTFSSLGKALRSLIPGGAALGLAARTRSAACSEAAPPPSDFDTAAPPPASEGGGSPAAPPSESGPLQFENFTKEFGQVSQQDNFDGFRIEAGWPNLQSLQLSHSLYLGCTQMRECGYIYQFGPTFQSEDQRTIVVARMGLDRAANGRLIKKIGSNGEFKGSANVNFLDPGRSMFEGSAEYSGSDWATAWKLGWQGCTIGSAAYSQVITNRLQMGGDMTLVAVNKVTSIGNIGLRYAHGKNFFTASLSRNPDARQQKCLHEVKLQYVRKLTERLSLASEYRYSHPDTESGMTMGYEYTFRMARVQGLVDTSGKVSCCISDFMGFGLSGVIDYVNENYKFGFMMHVVPPPEAGQGGPGM